ncbi:ankyrin repeat-containing domain protein [Pyronema domesticum]|uniref:Similar to Protein phosphatase 1 regulatory inhibitor subunit 16B acc. no. Q96T49 n=1 Tax=Pyronema omphalodes (strain CBS 100304) TaxID=1076935 RepID=U4LLJ0_PYROM|nr:ankyrin repeat-containing domain protein [Pyronema domesticum]CCX14253.1 Similar to Protein phosphatase 1 regulatory inhibitor subunit 16B; acc. no. Q96T49 [Pyronema omphalodes CBS 100304]
MLHTLPPELLLLIAESLPNITTLRSLLLTNRTFHSLLSPRLFSTIQTINHLTPLEILSLITTPSSLQKAISHFQTPIHELTLLLHSSITLQRPSLLPCLLKSGADPNLLIDGIPALHHALNAFYELSDTDLDSNPQSEINYTTTTTTTTTSTPYSTLSTLSLTLHHLLSSAANPNTFHEGLTPLHIASLSNLPSIVSLLLRYKADINALVQEEMMTALHIAAGNGFGEVVKVLVKKGADTRVVSRYGMPWDCWVKWREAEKGCVMQGGEEGEVVRLLGG